MHVYGSVWITGACMCMDQHQYGLQAPPRKRPCPPYQPANPGCDSALPGPGHRHRSPHTCRLKRMCARVNDSSSPAPRKLVGVGAAEGMGGGGEGRGGWWGADAGAVVGKGGRGEGGREGCVVAGLQAVGAGAGAMGEEGRGAWRRQGCGSSAPPGPRPGQEGIGCDGPPEGTGRLLQHVQIHE